MKTKELKEFKNKPVLDLKKDLIEEKTKLNGLRFDLRAGKVKNIKEMKGIKKKIAQILTILNFSK